MRPLRRGAAATETSKKSRRRAVEETPDAARRGLAIAAMRRAVSLYLASREAVSRDIAFLILPGAAEDRRSDLPPGRRGAHPGAVDLLVWTRGRGLVVGLCPARGRSRLAQEVFSGTLRRLGHEYRLIRAETPAHAVEQLEQLIDRAAQDLRYRIWEKP